MGSQLGFMLSFPCGPPPKILNSLSPVGNAFDFQAPKTIKRQLGNCKPDGTEAGPRGPFQLLVNVENHPKFYPLEKKFSFVIKRNQCAKEQASFRLDVVTRLRKPKRKKFTRKIFPQGPVGFPAFDFGFK